MLLGTAPSTSWSADAKARPQAAKAPKPDAMFDCPAAPVPHPDLKPYAWRDCADSPQLIRLPAGRFTMGEQSNSGTLFERPLREVDVPAFSIGRYEVTFDEWDACHRAGGCQRRTNDHGWGRGLRPVIDVSWVDAQQYVHWLSRKTGKPYRLPSEAEWEYAARAGTNTRYSWGDGAEWVCTDANVLDLTGRQFNANWHWWVYCDDGHATTAPVGSFRANPWGLHDMAGNVWEWVQDCWHNDYTGAPTDGSARVSGGDCGKRVNRGGGWGNNPRSMRSASRDADGAQGYSNALGFRVVREHTAEDWPEEAAPPPAADASAAGTEAPSGEAAQDTGVIR